MSADAIMPAPTKPTFMLMLGDCALCGKSLARGGHSRLATIDRGGVLARVAAPELMRSAWTVFFTCCIVLINRGPMQLAKNGCSVLVHSRPSIIKRSLSERVALLQQSSCSVLQKQMARSSPFPVSCMKIAIVSERPGSIPITQYGVLVALSKYV